MADALRRDAMDRAEGELLGAEEELVQRYGASRPTLRQAAALVVQEKLLKVKRGVGGGYFADRPDSRAVAHMAAIYLRTRHTQVSEVVGALAPIRVELAKLAAGGTNSTARERMRRFLRSERELAGDQIRYRDFLRDEREFGHILGEMGGNKVTALFLDILYDFSGMLSRNQDIYVNRPERVSKYREMRNRLAEAVIDGDVELAMMLAQRCAAASQEWIMQDFGRSSASAFPDLMGNPRAKGADDKSPDNKGSDRKSRKPVVSRSRS